MPSDVGSQIVTIRFHRPVDSDVVNKRFKDIRMLGIHKGGRMSWSTDVVTLSPLVCEISDDTHQVRVETTENVIQALTSGQYLVLRWAYTGVEDTDFMEVISADTIATNDIVVGQVVGTSVVYTARTTPDTHHLFLRIEEMETPSSSVRVRAGVGHAGSAHLAIIDQIVDLSGYNLNDVVYIYVNDSGGVTHSAIASSYAGKALLAKIVYPGDGIIENSDIEDVRSFITPPAIPDNSTINRDPDGKLQVKLLGITEDEIHSDVADGVTIKKNEITGKLQAKAWQTDGSIVFNTSMTAANTFQDLDLSAKVGGNSAFVFLEVKSGGTANMAAKPKGYGGTFAAHIEPNYGNSYGGCFFGAQGANQYAYMALTTNSSGVIQIGASNNSTSWTIKLIGHIAGL